MPILAQEPWVYPVTLLDGMQQEPTTRQWWVLYTRSRQEKAIARDLTALKVPFFLPLVKKTSCIRGKVLTATVPLFGGYVFLYGTEDERVCSLTTNRVAQVLEVHDQAQLQRDLAQLEQLIDSDAPLTVESRLAPGRQVRVKHGSLAGLEGVVVSRQGQTRLLVSVNFIQRGASVEVDDFMLEPID